MDSHRNRNRHLYHEVDGSVSHNDNDSGYGDGYRRFKRTHLQKLKRRMAVLEKSETCGDTVRSSNQNRTLFAHVFQRQISQRTTPSYIRKIASVHLSKAMPAIMRERQLSLEHHNKVFAAQWLDDHNVVMGTKCNNIIIKNVQTDKSTAIKPISSTRRYEAAECPCGIHAIDINPSRSLLATGAQATNDLAIYELPSFDAAFLGEGCHSDWIFDIKWIDDERVMTGSRDSYFAIWKIDDAILSERLSLESEDSDPFDSTSRGTGSMANQRASTNSDSSFYSTHDFDYSFEHSADNFDAESHPCEDGPLPIRRSGRAVVGSCLTKEKANNADKVRALAYNPASQEMGAISLSETILTWDLTTFKQKDVRRLPQFRETVCMAYNEPLNVYAVGSAAHVTLLDQRTLKTCINIESLEGTFGIRSVSFNEKIITIGTGYGTIIFYDMNAGRYLNCDCGDFYRLKSGRGYLHKDSNWRDYFSDVVTHNAIYAHCYDESKTRLFAAGGPLPASLSGNYAGIWQ